MDKRAGLIAIQQEIVAEWERRKAASATPLEGLMEDAAWNELCNSYFVYLMENFDTSVPDEKMEDAMKIANVIFNGSEDERNELLKNDLSDVGFCLLESRRLLAYYKIPINPKKLPAWKSFMEAFRKFVVVKQSY